ncbi:MAG: septum formation inhibitor Maf [Gammaproteobacteria bacterium]|nr:MAG: septum formation inhibitor Maf [Gammaproteobacteria bacterium]
MHTMKLILASTSPFRKQLLDRLDIPYETDSPNIDESPLADEDVVNMVKRLAEAKARAVASRHPNALIIGSDQSAVLNDTILSKPGTYDKAFQQLKNASGQKIIFQTGLCLLNSTTGQVQTCCVPYTVVFKQLTDGQIDHYLQKEQPYNCAGSFKSEGLGIALFERFEGDDPNALIGLPLIKLVEMLDKEGISIL